MKQVNLARTLALAALMVCLLALTACSPDRTWKMDKPVEMTVQRSWSSNYKNALVYHYELYNPYGEDLVLTSTNAYPVGAVMVLSVSLKK